MSSDWPRVSLRDFADLLAGFAFKSSGYTENSQDVRLLRGDNIAPGRVRWDGVKRWPKNCGVDLAKYALEPGDVVLAMDRPWIPAGLKVAQTTEIDTPSYLVQRVARLRAGSGADCDFLFSLLSAPEFESYIQNATTGTAVPHISAKQILDYEFRLPPASVRVEVGALLAAINNRITLLRETNATLEAIAQALFKSWFVDFDPVHAQMQGRATEGMDEATAALFPDSFEESELGPVPKGWSIKAMADVSTVGIGKTPPRKEQHWFSESQSDVRWVSIRDMGSVGVYAAETSEFLTTDAVEKFNVRRVPDNTVLMSFKMTIGRVAITDGEMTTNEAIAHFKLEPGAPITSEFIYLHLKQFDFSKLSSTSSIADAVNSKTVREIPILVPSFKVLRAFQDHVGVLFSALKNGEQHAQSIAQMRDALLPRLISGQLQIEEVTEALP